MSEQLTPPPPDPTAERLAEIEKRLSAATPGPWKWIIAELREQLEAVRLVGVKFNGHCSSSGLARDIELCVSGWHNRAVNAEAERDKLAAQLAEARADGERLDWLVQHECAIGRPQPEDPLWWLFVDVDKGRDVAEFSGAALRAAIDAAIAAQKAEGKGTP